MEGLIAAVGQIRRNPYEKREPGLDKPSHAVIFSASTESYFMYLETDPRDVEAAAVGIAAATALERGLQSRPGVERFRTLHALRVTSRRCPASSLALAIQFTDWTSAGKHRPKREETELRLFERSGRLGIPRLRDPEEDFQNAPADEGRLREVIGNGLATAGARIANAGKPEMAVGYFKQAIKIFPCMPLPMTPWAEWACSGRRKPRSIRS